MHSMRRQAYTHWARVCLVSRALITCFVVARAQHVGQTYRFAQQWPRGSLRNTRFWARNVFARSRCYSLGSFFDCWVLLIKFCNESDVVWYHAITGSGAQTTASKLMPKLLRGRGGSATAFRRFGGLGRAARSSEPHDEAWHLSRRAAVMTFFRAYTLYPEVGRASGHLNDMAELHNNHWRILLGGR